MKTKLYKIILTVIPLLIISNCGSHHLSNEFLSEEQILAQAETLYEQGKYSDAATKFNFLFLNYAFSSYKSYSCYMVGECFFQDEKWNDAIDAFRLFINRFPADSLYPDAMYKLAYSYQMNAPGMDKDQSDRKRALQQYLYFTARFPDHPYHDDALLHMVECEEVLISKLIHEAYIYRTMNQPHAALVTLLTAVYMYPYTDNVNRANFEIAELFLQEKDTNQALEYLFKIPETGTEYSQRAQEIKLDISRNIDIHSTDSVNIQEN
jgi:outer membrane protein assembly factor BamD